MPGTNKRIIALHGSGMPAEAWKNLVPHLTWPCEAITFPGHGHTEDAFLPTIEKMAAWIKAQLVGMPPHSVVLMGHSMGALVALEAAHDPAVAALIFLGAATQMPVHPDLLKQAKENPDTAADMILKWGVSAAHPEAAAIKSDLKKNMQRVPPGALFNDLNACNDYQRGTDALKGITQPALILSGADDKLTKPAAGQALANFLPQSRFQVLPDSGHMLMAEKPLETAAEINRFLALTENT